jgi:hypothetical protein
MIQDGELLRELGLVGYLLLTVIVLGAGLMSWMVKRLVDALITSHMTTTEAIGEIVKHEATEQELLDRMSQAIEETMRTSAAHLEIARQWQAEGARRT